MLNRNGILFFIVLFFSGLMLYVQQAVGSNQPGTNLGRTNILDGGPLRLDPGWYVQEFLSDYNSSTLVNGVGQPASVPNFGVTTLLSQLIYQSNKEILLSGKWGVDAVLPMCFSNTRANSSGAGVGDLALGEFLQFGMIGSVERPIFVQRLEFVAIFPTGQYDVPQYSVNPGNGQIFFDPYWAATLYFTPKLATSWRLYYMWSTYNSTTQVQAGDVVHLNFDLAYAITKNLWLGPCGYFLQQLNNDKQYGVVIPNSRERVLGLGPGVLYDVTKDLHFFGYMYFENDVRARPQGMSFTLRMVYHFDA